MKHITHVSIPQPCTQNWGDMDPTTQGRFCSSCQKRVTDFTKLSNEQILALLSLSGNTCGRITEVQLRTLNACLQHAPQPESSWWRRLSIATVFVSLLSLFRSEAKGVAPKAPQHATFEFKKMHANANFADDQITITGKVVDENNEILPGATVRIKGTNKSVMVGTDGTFSIKVPSGQTIKLQVLFIGFETKEVKIKPKNAKDKLDLKLKMSAAILGGLGVVYSPKDTMIA